jgi:copper chaperone
MKTEIIKVTGMTCGHCKNSVATILKELNGVSDVEVMLDSGSAKISYDEGKLSREQIVKAVNETGTYHAE